MNIVRQVVAAAFVLSLTSMASAAVVAEFDYNAATNIGDATTGTGTTSGGGSFPFSSTLPNNNGSSADPGTTITQGLNNQEWTRRGPNAGEASGDRTVTWSTSTAGHTDIGVTWDMVAGHRTSRYYQIMASTDGTTFAPVSGGVATGASTAGVGSATVDTFGLITVNFDDGFDPEPGTDPVNPINFLNDLSYQFPSGSAYENNPSFAFQIAAVHAPSGNDYISSFAGTLSTDLIAGYARAGETDTRYDLVRITGNVVPEPSGLALVMFGLAAVGMFRRRK